MLAVYYDLAKSPPTYDVVSFLCAVERERILRGENYVDIFFLPGPDDGFRKDKVWPFTTAERVMMRDKVAMPICRLSPAARSVQLFKGNRPAQGFGVGQTLHMWRNLVEGCGKGIRPLRVAAKPDRDLVTITLREAAHWPERNSNVPVWLDVGAELAKSGKRVVFVRDTVLAQEPLPGVATDPASSMEIPARATLYRSAFCNLFVGNGPAWFSVVLDAPTMIVKPTNEKSLYTASDKFFAQCGVKRGGQLPNSPVYQRLVWSGDDEVEPIMSAFRQFSREN